MASFSKKLVKFSFLATAGFLCGFVLYFLFLPGRAAPLKPDYPLQQVKPLRPDLENILVYYPPEAILIASFDQADACLKLSGLAAGSELELSARTMTLADLYEEGGPGLLLATLNDLLELDLQKYVLLDDAFLAGFIDKAGGLEMDLTADDLEFINSCLAGKRLEVGPVNLNGQEAVCWSKAGPGQQQELMRALMSKTSGWQLLPLLEQASRARSSWQTNLHLADLVRLGWQGMDRQVLWHEIGPSQPGPLDWQAEKLALALFLAPAGQED